MEDDRIGVDSIKVDGFRWTHCTLECYSKGSERTSLRGPNCVQVHIFKLLDCFRNFMIQMAIYWIDRFPIKIPIRQYAFHWMKSGCSSLDAFRWTLFTGYLPSDTFHWTLFTGRFLLEALDATDELDGSPIGPILLHRRHRSPAMI